MTPARLAAAAAGSVACLAVIAALSTGSAGASAPAAAAAPEATAVAVRYVALGDSYTSAPGVLPVSATAVPACGQSAVNYPHLVAERLRADLADVSCGGAKTADLLGSQLPGVPAQLQALGADATLVTLGIGGNDNDLFATAIAGCVTTIADVIAGELAPCSERFGDRFSRDIAASGEDVRAALRRIHELAPQAEVVVVGYPSLLPTTPAGQLTCAAAGVPFAPADIAYLDALERDLNAMLRDAAADTGSRYLDTYTPSVGHDMCALPGVRWIEPLIPLSPAAPVHPNAAGQAAVADGLTALLTET